MIKAVRIPSGLKSECTVGKIGFKLVRLQLPREKSSDFDFKARGMLLNRRKIDLGAFILQQSLQRGTLVLWIEFQKSEYLFAHSAQPI